MKKHIIIGAIAATLVLFLGGFLFYGMSGVLESYVTPEGMAVSLSPEEASVPLIFVGQLIFGVIMTLLYSKWARGVHSFGHGFQFGALIGAGIGIGLGLIFVATAKFMSPTGYIIDGLYNIIIYGLAGGVLGLIFDRMEE